MAAVVGADVEEVRQGFGEEGVRALPEGGGLLALVGEDLTVGESGVVVDGGVDRFAWVFSLVAANDSGMARIGPVRAGPSSRSRRSSHRRRSTRDISRGK